MPRALAIRLRFPRGAYSGGDLGTPEAVPSPARVHAAFAAAAAGGPYAAPDGRVLVAAARHRRALEWLESQAPFAVRLPRWRQTDYPVVRYRRRVGESPDGTPFEPFSALDGPVSYFWPVPGETEIVDALRELAPEVEYVGRVESSVIASVAIEDVADDDPDCLVAASGRGPGQVLRAAAPGRLAALVDAHARASEPRGHHAGRPGKQTKDKPVETAGEQATALQRYMPPRRSLTWPFSEVWQVRVTPPLPRWAQTPQRRVGTAVAVHRALIAAIGHAVPDFITGRDGEGPRRGAGHLAIHVTEDHGLLLALPADVGEADRAVLLDALARSPGVRIGGKSHRLGLPTTGPAARFWRTESRAWRTEVPLVLDTAGPPRHGAWTLDDAVLCSVGYAIRAVLEGEGVEWGAGWAFRRRLVDELRSRGVAVQARRVTRRASRYVHRAREGDLLVAAHATVTPGSLAPDASGFLALGRARHLGGGLLRPV